MDKICGQGLVGFTDQSLADKAANRDLLAVIHAAHGVGRMMADQALDDFSGLSATLFEMGLAHRVQ